MQAYRSEEIHYRAPRLRVSCRPTGTPKQLPRLTFLTGTFLSAGPYCSKKKAWVIPRLYQLLLCAVPPLRARCCMDRATVRELHKYIFKLSGTATRRQTTCLGGMWQQGDGSLHPPSLTRKCDLSNNAGALLRKNFTSTITQDP